MGEPLIVSKGRYELSIMALFKEKSIEPMVKYEFNHPDTALSFIRQGLGIALLPELTLKSHGRKIMLRGAGTHLLSTNFPVSKRTTSRRKPAIFIAEMYGNPDR
ncbi:transcriptional regulator [Salmonella bongori]|nr:transcriptional regulator [Salmonella bongori]